MAKVARLVTRGERDAVAALGAAADVLRDLPPEVVARLPRKSRVAISRARRALRSHAHAQESIWPGGYNMISRVQAKHVYNLIRRLPPHKRPVQVRDAFALVLFCVDQDTAEIPFNRSELAAELGCAPSSVTKIMATLEELGVVQRKRRTEPGYRNQVVYEVNVHTAWNGDLEFRKEIAARQTPPTEKRRKPKLVQPTPAEAAE